MKSRPLHIAFSLFSIFIKASSSRKPIWSTYFLIEEALWKMENNEEAMCKVPLCILFKISTGFEFYHLSGYLKFRETSRKMVQKKWPIVYYVCWLPKIQMFISWLYISNKSSRLEFSSEITPVTILWLLWFSSKCTRMPRFHGNCNLLKNERLPSKFRRILVIEPKNSS